MFLVASDPPPPYTPPTEGRRQSSDTPTDSPRLSGRYSDIPPRPSNRPSSHPRSHSTGDIDPPPPTYSSVVSMVTTHEGGDNSDSPVSYSQTLSSRTDNNTVVQTSSLQVRRGSGTPVIEVTQVNQHVLPTVQNTGMSNSQTSLPGSSSSDSLPRLCSANDNAPITNRQQVRLVILLLVL